MATLDELDNQLTAAAMLLDAAAGSIRDCPLHQFRSTFDA
jgi:hypothetical protein